MSSNNNRSAWYAVRRTLPLWSFEENLKELVEFLPKYKVDELIVKIDSEEFTHGQADLEWVANYQEKLFRIKEAMAQLGIVYSLNPWITTGHCDRGRNAKEKLPGLKTLVGHDGTESTCCACSLSEVWRAHTSKIWTLYAETKPQVIWIEDDIRTFNHKPVEFSCFCSEHLAKFSERVGRKVSREELVDAILQEGTPHPWRSEYLDMQSEVMTDAVAFLAGIVHKVSPNTSLGLMSSGARSHCMEGRNWNDFSKALADGKTLYSRPCLYYDESLETLYSGADQIKLTRHCVPNGAIEQSELDNAPFTKYAHSTVFTFLKLALSFAYGCHGVTMNLYDHCGTPMEADPSVGKMLAEKKYFLEALAEKCGRDGVFRGVQLLFNEKSSYYKQLKNDNIATGKFEGITTSSEYSILADEGDSAMLMLDNLGIPTTYDDEDVVAVCGQTLRCYSDDEIMKILRKGLLLDAVAAGVLFERGFGKYIGLKAIEEPILIDDIEALSAEEYCNVKFGGADKKFLTLTLPGYYGRPQMSLAEIYETSEIISYAVNPDAERSHVMMYAFENELGGRVVVHLLDLSSAHGRNFNHLFRVQQIQAVVKWLAREKVSLIVNGDGAFPLSFRKDCGNNSIIGFFNLSFDPWQQVEFMLYDLRTISTCRILSGSEWIEDNAVSISDDGKGNKKLIYHCQVNFSMPMFIMIDWK